MEVKLQTKLTLFVPKRPVQHRHYTLRRHVVSFASVDDFEKAMEDLGWLVRRPTFRDTRVFKKCRCCNHPKPRREFGNRQWQRDDGCRSCKSCTSRARELEKDRRALRAMEDFVAPLPRPVMFFSQAKLEHPVVALPQPRPRSSIAAALQQQQQQYSSSNSNSSAAATALQQQQQARKEPPALSARESRRRFNRLRRRFNRMIDKDAQRCALEKLGRRLSPSELEDLHAGRCLPPELEVLREM